MKIKSDDYVQKSNSKRRRLEKWHRWFAWYPVRVDRRTLVWLEFVNRKAGEFSIYDSVSYWLYEANKEE